MDGTMDEHREWRLARSVAGAMRRGLRAPDLAGLPRRHLAGIAPGTIGLLEAGCRMADGYRAGARDVLVARDEATIREFLGRLADGVADGQSGPPTG